MASFSIEEFVGNGALKDLVPKLLEEGWDDIPTLKIMNSEDMNAINMTQNQKDALEIRSYLHDRDLMQYGDKLESFGKSLPELLNVDTLALSSQFGIKRGHIARFTDRLSACGIPSPRTNVLPARKRSTSHSPSVSRRDLLSVNSRRMQSTKSHLKSSLSINAPYELSISDMKIKDGHIYKGIVAAEPAEPRLCGCIQPPPIADDVSPYSAIENISVQKLTPEYKIGMERLVKTKTPPMKASGLWRDKPVILLCIRRPGCIMCRAEAHQLYSRKTFFDALGIQLIAVLHEHIDSEIQDFWPRYWGGVVVLDQNMDFFKALGGGKLLKDKFLTGFVFNPRAIANYKRAKAMGLEQNFRGEGEIKGGLFIVGNGKSGIAYQFIERNFGDWAPFPEITEICTRLQKPEQDHPGKIEESPEG
ncbi:Redox-regulatory protein [Thalictrum thalictroides]|uniref:Peroxiredoxin-like 2A n=1 Tax=Thalictrum thalictroides TaxID=46969 RepID=A0A7J6X9E8_THATH|nr:Redox-regulatory protein [Thalictrum thalictroides]